MRYIIILSLLFIVGCTLTITVEDDGKLNITTPTQEVATWTPTPAPEMVRVNTSGTNLNCRSAPSSTGVVLTKLPNNSIMEVIDKVPSWVKVSYNNIQCWAYSAYLEEA